MTNIHRVRTVTATMDDKIRVLYRQLFSKMVSSLASYFGLPNLALAEDVVQDTFIAALENWSESGLPSDPTAWLFKVCKNKAINALSSKKYQHASFALEHDHGKSDYRLEQLFLDYEIKDNQLRLLFACCHPDLSPKAQVVLVLKNLCGLKVEEIARGLAMTDEAIMKTLSRSRQTLKEKNVALHVPLLMRSHERLSTVHLAIYLLFNEGYNATEGEALIRKDLCLEAMRLVRSLIDIPEISTNDTYALFALMCFHTARFSARTGGEGELIELEQQDRSLWDHELITLGIQYLKKTGAEVKPTRFTIEAAIASLHCSAKTFSETSWSLIVRLYDQLRVVNPSPFTDLNRTVALFFAEGADVAFQSLEQSPHLNWLKNYYLYYALLGKMSETKGDREVTLLHYKKALSLTKLKAEQEFLRKKIALYAQ